MLKRIAAAAIAAILGSVIGMNGYLASSSREVSRQDWERGLWIAVSQTGVGSAIAVTLALVGVGLVWRDEEVTGDAAVLRYARKQSKRKDLDANTLAHWIALCDELEANK